MIPLFDWKEHRILMESHFEYDGYDFLFFDEGIPYFSLYRGTRKINTELELRYVGEVLLYLNPDIDYDYFVELMLELTDRGNGHVVRTYTKERTTGMCESIYRTFSSKKMPYVRRYRKVMFNPAKRMTTDEKMSIVGHVMGRINKIDEEKIYEAIETMMDEDKPISMTSLANTLQCSRQTVYRNITNPLKWMIEGHNQKFTKIFGN